MPKITYDRATSHFPVENIPFGVFLKENTTPHICTRIGDTLIDLHSVSVLLSKDSSPVLPKETLDALQEPTLNTFMSQGRASAKAVRTWVQHTFSTEGEDDKKFAEALFPAIEAKLVLPATIGDYTDFYSSREHATNVGKMFRPTMAPLLPNWLHLPVAYHGRSSSIIVSGTPVTRPNGQTRPKETEPPIFGPCKALDMEVEVAAWVGKPNTLGEPITLANASEHIFGLSLFNDWSARDLQKWEYVPLGPFLGKNFASTISPWIVTMDALEPFLVQGPVQDDPPVLPYLQQGFPGAVDLHLEAEVKEKGGEGYGTICKTNMKWMYWSIFQQIVHHTVNGCNLRAGDVFASGTISGPTEDSFGSCLELSWAGTKKINIGNGKERTYFADGDSVNLKGVCKGKDYLIGFGPCEGTILPAPKYI